ncbi:alpha-1,4-glucan--maltose-1-phosphate maltosyltransferase [Affinirhizobium pseudoryzae]|uniref:alpha-1,4-glucan--maltose-1-phosphate maltosyltransferase n=1 Tax=Allorhizobium pseudoryzae TaxID=379684 RepID=UPI0013EC5599|nr:alpha-1,4-glucan--maltose-1-phosphate maltosyltransferase [Allorhizobium pseudoryzae]
MNVAEPLPSRITTPSPAPRLYYVHPLMLGDGTAWEGMFRHASDLGFDTVLTAPLVARPTGGSVFVARDADRLDPAYGLGEDVDAGLRRLCEMAKAHGLRLMVDLVLDREAVDEDAPSSVLADPRLSPNDRSSRQVMAEDAGTADRMLAAWGPRLERMVEAGVAGFRCLGLDRVPEETWRQLIKIATDRNPTCVFLAWTPGTSFDLRRRLPDLGFHGCFSSLAWWDLESRWFMEEYEIQRRFAFQITFPEAPFARRLAHGMDSTEIRMRRARQALHLSATLGQGLMIPIGFEYGATAPLDPTFGDGEGLRGLAERQTFDLSAEIRATNGRLQGTADAFSQKPLQLIASTQSPALALMQADSEDRRRARSVRLVVVNRDLRRSAPAPLNALREAASAFLPLKPADQPQSDTIPAALRLQPGELRLLEGTASPAIRDAVPAEDVMEAAASPRLAIEAITPAVDDGRFPVKRIVGETVTVEADVFGDGHDPISAALVFRAADEADWTEVPMRLIENDRWRGEFTPRRMGRYEFAVETWRNPFQIFRYELSKKHEARLDLKLELQEGVNLIRASLDSASGYTAEALQDLLTQLDQAAESERVVMLLAPETFALMAKADRRPHRVRSQAIPLDAERREAGFASWYQIFPRSQSGDPNRHGTFDDVIQRLPAIREMGFDVLYFPPIHPIGKTNRKGRNNSLTAGPNDPGSPYGIGSEDGGHDAIHPELGTFEDFRRLVAAAEEHGLEIALDLAIQASPDHPWLKDHPGWFDWRPDGTVRYAENPPKKYEDIVNVDFYAKDAVPSLWVELRDVVQKWVDNGVKLFRVDNPHTKPLPFWEWLIADIRNRHPEVVFLSEAFTRPKVMYRLAKVGFSQSYTYFTWRNTKWELETYMREITTEAPKEFFRPHFFVNTHDINPDFLQNAPRSAYLIRAALAATLSGLWGVYNGFELCEGRPDAKRKEYADSEKYEIRAWDYDRPGHIKGEIAMLNRIRRENPALHSHLGLKQLIAWNDNIMFYEKASPGRENVLLVGVSLDPHHVQEADVEIPLWSWNLPDHGALNLEDLVTGQTFVATGKWQRLRLQPHLPFSIWRVR